MTQHLGTSSQDRPIECKTDDQLNRGPFVESLVRALVIEQVNDLGERIGWRATGYVVGLTGPWGLGKSSVLNLVHQQLGSTDGVVVALFNPWLFNGRDELVKGFFNSLRSALGRNRAEKGRGLIEAVDRYWGAIDLAARGVAATVDLHGGSGIATVSWKTWGSRFRSAFSKPVSATPNEERAALEKKIAGAKCAVVVLIDELDRLEDDEVRSVAQLIKAIGDIVGISYLVAYDPERVVLALGRGEKDERRSSGELYLEKIIQHPIPLRPLFAEDVRALLQAALDGWNVDLKPPRNEHERELLDSLVLAIKTPREIKRLVGAFSVLELAVRGEICAYDVLGYCWILTKAPAVRGMIAQHFDKLVSDPSEQELLRRGSGLASLDRKTDVVSLLGEAAKSQEIMLQLLFPNTTKNFVGDAGDRLFRRRNLIRMLYLGNPPDMISRANLEALWGICDVDELEHLLRKQMGDGQLVSILDRLDDLLPALPVAGDMIFWVALSRALHRRTDWLTGPESARAIAADAATILYQMPLRDQSLMPRVENAVNALIADSDLVLLPAILRKHLFVHGLTPYSKAGRRGNLWDSNRTAEIFANILPAIKRAVIDGSALRRLPNLEAVFVILNAQKWDESLRSSFTMQLNSYEAITTLSGLLVPPGFTVSRAILDELFRADEIAKRLNSFIDDQRMPVYGWLRDSLQRLQHILLGKDIEPDE